MNPHIVDLSNLKFGRLTVIKRVQSNSLGDAKYLCACNCGKEVEILAKSLKSGRTKSCGCLSREVAKAFITIKNTKHGMSKRGQQTKTYITWASMIQRCYNPKNKSYKNYGARGIYVCDAWHDFNGFYKDMGDAPKNYTIERIDNNREYSKSNCVWASHVQQNNNRRDNIILYHDGQLKTLAQWSKTLNIPYLALYYKFRKNRKTMFDFLSTPVAE